MTPCKGNWKWGRKEAGMVDPCDILMQVAAPTMMGELWAINCNELVEVTKLFADRKM